MLDLSRDSQCVADLRMSAEVRGTSSFALAANDRFPPIVGERRFSGAEGLTVKSGKAVLRQIFAFAAVRE